MLSPEERKRRALALGERQKEKSKITLASPLPEPAVEDHSEPTQESRVRSAASELAAMPWGIKKAWIYTCLGVWGALGIGALSGNIVGAVILSPLLVLGLFITLNMPLWIKAALTPFALKRNTGGKYI